MYCNMGDEEQEQIIKRFKQVTSNNVFLRCENNMLRKVISKKENEISELKKIIKRDSDLLKKYFKHVQSVDKKHHVPTNHILS